MDKVQNPDKEVRKMIRFDKDREFASLLKSNLPEDYVGTSVNLSSPELWKLICSYQAVKCAAAILKSESGYYWNPNMPLGDGLFPLSLAAQSLCYSLTELLLQSGAQPDPGSNDNLAKHPLILAPDAIGHNSVFSDWTEKKSIFKLFYILSIIRFGESVELLVSESKLVDTISVRCVKNGDIVQLVALLIVAWDKLMVPFADQGIEHSPTGQFILDELEVLSQQEKKYMGCGFDSTLGMLHERKVKLEAAWKAVKVLETAHGTFKMYRKRKFTKWFEPHYLPFAFAGTLWSSYKMALTPEEIYVDDVKCLRPGLKPRRKAWLRRKIMEQVHKLSTSPTTLQMLAAGTGSCLRSYDTFQALDSKAMRDCSSGSLRQELCGELMNQPIIRFTGDDGDSYASWCTELDKDEHSFLYMVNSTPLHEAARRSSLKLTAVLLGRGEVADTRIDYNKDGLILKDVLPLDLALANIRSHSFLEEWNKSAFQLIGLLSHGMEYYLEIVRLLACSTKEVDKLFIDYVRGGNMVEVGALLMVGYRPSSTFQLQDLDGVHEEGIIELLEIFERIGVELSAHIRIERSKDVTYSQLVAEIASLFQMSE